MENSYFVAILNVLSFPLIVIYFLLPFSSLPVWFKSALFNETYFVSDGGTVWLDIKRKKDIHGRPIPEAVKKYGRFAYLEGKDKIKIMIC